MPKLTGRHEVLRRKKRLESAFELISNADLTPELMSHFARYLSVLVSGHVEQSVKELVTEYVRVRSDAKVQRYVGNQLKKLQNINQNKLRQLVESFNPEWWQTISGDHVDELAALDSVTAVRNSVSHGGDSGITLLIIRQYFDLVSILLNYLSELLDPLVNRSID